MDKFVLLLIYWLLSFFCVLLNKQKSNYFIEWISEQYWHSIWYFMCVGQHQYLQVIWGHLIRIWRHQYPLTHNHNMACHSMGLPACLSMDLPACHSKYGKALHVCITKHYALGRNIVKEDEDDFVDKFHLLSVFPD